MGAGDVPRLLDDVSAEWLTGALYNAGALTEGEVEAVDVQRMAEGVGLMSQIARLTIRYSHHANPCLPTTMVIKLPATSGSNREMAEQYGLFEREVRFYSELAHRVGVRTPRAFVRQYDPASGDGVLVLEELAARGGDSVTPLADDDVRLIVRDMARMHAQWWEGCGATPPDWLPRLDGPTWADHEPMFAAAWKAFACSPAAARFSRLAEIGQLIAPSVPSLQRRLSRSPVTLVHFDFRLSNLFLCPAGEGDELVVIDWQPLSVARGAYDLGYFLSQSIPTGQRRALEHEILGLYHATLVRNGIGDYHEEALREDYRLSVGYTSSYAVCTFLIDLANSTGRGYARHTLARAAAAVDDLGVADLLQHTTALLD